MKRWDRRDLNPRRWIDGSSTGSSILEQTSRVRGSIKRWSHWSRQGRSSLPPRRKQSRLCLCPSSFRPIELLRLCETRYAQLAPTRASSHFFLLFFFRTWKIISPSRCVKRINKRVIPPDRDKSNRARSGRTTISNDFTRNYSFPSFFLFFLSSLLDIGKLHRLDCESCDYVRIFVVRLYDTEQKKWSSHEVVAGRLDSRGRGLFEGAPWLTYDGSVAYGIYGTARCFHPSIHPKDEETIVDDSGREKGTFNAGQTSVTRVGGRARMGTFMVNFDGLCNPL